MRGLAGKLRRAFAPKPLNPASIDIEGRKVAVVFRRNPRAKRLIMRLSRDRESAIVTVPRSAGRGQALEFVQRSADWLSKQLKRHETTRAAADNAHIALRGVRHSLCYTGERRGLVTVDDVAVAVRVPGDAPHAARRLKEFLKAEAKRDLDSASQRYAMAMGVAVRRITVRDQKSRWGSCSASGDLSYSWRLILAPEFVLDYVAAHEVAHLRHMNHGPAFWKLVLRHCPSTSEAKKWLKAHGETLYSLLP